MTPGNVPLSVHNTQNIPSSDSHDSHGHCGHSENVTNDVIILSLFK